jgi:hypothetical protein
MKKILLIIFIITLSVGRLLAQDKKVADTATQEYISNVVINDRPDSIFVPELGRKIKVYYDASTENDLDAVRRNLSHPLNDVMNVPDQK